MNMQWLTRSSNLLNVDWPFSSKDGMIIDWYCSLAEANLRVILHSMSGRGVCMRIWVDLLGITWSDSLQREWLVRINCNCHRYIVAWPLDHSLLKMISNLGLVRLVRDCWHALDFSHTNGSS